MVVKWCLGYAPRVLLHATNLRHGTDNFTSLPKEGVPRNFLSPFKNPTASAGFEPSNLGTIGQHATSAPPKPPTEGVYKYSNIICPYFWRYVTKYPFKIWLTFVHCTQKLEPWSPDTDSKHPHNILFERMQEDSIFLRNQTLTLDTSLYNTR